MDAFFEVHGDHFTSIDDVMRGRGFVLHNGVVLGSRPQSKDLFLLACILSLHSDNKQAFFQDDSW